MAENQSSNSSDYIPTVYAFSIAIAGQSLLTWRNATHVISKKVVILLTEKCRHTLEKNKLPSQQLSLGCNVFVLFISKRLKPKYKRVLLL